MEMSRELPELTKSFLGRDAALDLRTIDAKLHLKFADEQLQFLKIVDFSPKWNSDISSFIKK